MKYTRTQFQGYTSELFEPDDAPKTNGGSPGKINVPTWPVMGTAAYYGLAGNVVATLLPHTESDPVALLLQYLVSFGSAAGRQQYYEIEAASHYAILYAVIVGDTAMARKGTAAQQIRRVYQIAAPEWVQDHVGGGISSGEGIIHAVRDPIYVMKKGILELSDPGVSDKRLLFEEREFSSVLDSIKRETNIASRVLRDAWDSPPLLRTHTKNNPSKASNPHISVIGHITLTELRRKLDETSMANGFGNRFLYACARRSKSLPHGGTLDMEKIGLLSAATLEALTNATAPMKITMSSAAAELWTNNYDRLTRASDNMLDFLISRAAPQTLRLAMIYAMLDRSAQIEQAHLEAGLAVWDYCAASVRFIFSDRTGDPIADTILIQLQFAGVLGMSRWEITGTLFGRNTPAYKITTALKQLREAGKIRCEMQPPPNKIGRPREMWFIVE